MNLFIRGFLKALVINVLLLGIIILITFLL